MGTLRDGALDLGLVVDWRFAFVSQGTSVEPTPGAVYLDVGGRVTPGVLDQHGDKTLGDSSGQLVLRYPEAAYSHLMADWLRRRDDGQVLSGRPFTPRIVVHYAPDFDSVTGALLVMYLVETGDLPPWARALVEYAGSVDQGRYRLELGEGPATGASVAAELAPVHLAFLAMQSLAAPPGVDRNLWQLQRGLALVRAEIAAMQAAGNNFRDLRAFCPGGLGVGGWRAADDGRAFADLAALLAADFEAHAKDWADARTVRVRLPDRTGRYALEVDGSVLEREPTAKLHKYWFRARGRPFTLTPVPLPRASGAGAPTAGVFERVIISLDAAWRDAKDRPPSLRGLGARLEVLECEARSREPGGDARLKTPRWPGVTNADPWYDGRGHDFTIVDSPSSGTRLTLAQVVEVATQEAFWETPVDEVELCVIERRRGGDPIPSRPGEASEALPVEIPLGTIEPLEPWYAQSRQRPTPTDESVANLTAEAFLRTFPANTCRPIRVSTYCTSPGRTVTLEALAAQLDDQREALRRAGAPPPHVVLRYRLAGPPHEGIAALERRIVGSKLEALISPTGDDHAERLLVGPQGCVERLSTDAEDPPLPSVALREALLYTVFVFTTLNEYSVRIAKAVEEAKRPFDKQVRERSAARVREVYLEFQAMHYQLVVSELSSVQAIHARLRAELAVEAYHEEVARELERLAEYEQQLAAERNLAASDSLNRLMGMVSLTAVMQTAMGIVALAQFAELFDRVIAVLWIGGWTGLVLYYWWRVYRRLQQA